MNTVKEAVTLIQANRLKLKIQNRSLTQSLGLELAEDIFSDRAYPPINRVMMDGIAIRHSAYAQGLREFKIKGIASAGSAPLINNEADPCIEVMTGAALPEGCDLVIPYEHLDIKNNFAFITRDESYYAFSNIHIKGSDCKEGDHLLTTGTVISGPIMGILASVGKNEVKVFDTPRVLIISTGDELVEVGVTPLDYQLRRSNVHALAASLKLHGYDKIDTVHLEDNFEKMLTHFLDITTKYDILIYSGGVSKGKFDFLPQVFTDAKVTKKIHGVKQRPGKPLWFGIDETHQTHVWGLPGNPVSGLICLHRYFLNVSPLKVQLTQEITFKPDLTYFVPVKMTLKENWQAEPVLLKNSGEFTTLALSDGFIELPQEKDTFYKGEFFDYYPWRPLF